MIFWLNFLSAHSPPLPVSLVKKVRIKNKVKNNFIEEE